MLLLHMLPIYALGIDHHIETPEVHRALSNEYGRSKDDEAQNIWAYCFSPRERIKYIRKNRSQFEFHDYRQMVRVVRGHCFTGCASELVNLRRRFRVRAWRLALLFCVATWLVFALAVIRAVR